MFDEVFYGTTASDVFDRLKYIFRVKTSKDLAHKIMVSESAISNAIKRNSIPYALCANVAEMHNVPMDWILFGDVDGDINRGHYRIVKSEYLRRAYAHADIDGKDQISELFGDTGQVDADWIPLYDLGCPLGEKGISREDSIGNIPFGRAWLTQEGLEVAQSACFLIVDDGMSPILKKDDIVLVDLQTRTGDGVFAIRMGNALRVKRLQWLANGDLRISSDNPIYQTEQITPAELAGDFDILGACHTRISRVG